MRHLVTIQSIADLQPIPEADAIEKAKVKDWWVVVKKDQFKIGDLCIYHEIDSYLPVTPDYDFLLKGNAPKKMMVDGNEKEGIRLKTIRLRGQISQGLLLPWREGLPIEIGADITEQLGVFKYEPPIPVHLSGDVKGFFPGFLPKTDEERIQNCGHLLQEHRGLACYVTSKLDGTSATYYKNGEFGACSRNLEMKESGVLYWRIAKDLDLPNKLPDGFCIQGEIVGDGIQGNPLKIDRNKQLFFVFNVYDIKKGEYLSYKDLVTFVNDLGLQMVPVITDNFVLNHSVEDLLELAMSNSPINSSVLQEGIVIRPLVEQKAMIGGGLQRLSFKVVSNYYLLKYE